MPHPRAPAFLAKEESLLFGMRPFVCSLKKSWTYLSFTTLLMYIEELQYVSLKPPALTLANDLSLCAPLFIQNPPPKKAPPSSACDSNTTCPFATWTAWPFAWPLATPWMAVSECTTCIDPPLDDAATEGQPVPVLGGGQ